MAYKFCENHLAELYEAIKTNNISELEKIEHELSSQEECIACAYALKAQGEAKQVLFKFLKGEGLLVEAPKEKTILDHLIYWGPIALILTIIFVMFDAWAKSFLARPLDIIFASVIAGITLIIYTQFFD